MAALPLSPADAHGRIDDENLAVAGPSGFIRLISLQLPAQTLREPLPGVVYTGQLHNRV